MRERRFQIGPYAHMGWVSYLPTYLVRNLYPVSPGVPRRCYVHTLCMYNVCTYLSYALRHTIIIITRPPGTRCRQEDG